MAKYRVVKYVDGWDNPFWRIQYRHWFYLPFVWSELVFKNGTAEFDSLPEAMDALRQYALKLLAEERNFVKIVPVKDWMADGTEQGASHD